MQGAAVYKGYHVRDANLASREKKGEEEGRDGFRTWFRRLQAGNGKGNEGNVSLRTGCSRFSGSHVQGGISPGRETQEEGGREEWMEGVVKQATRGRGKEKHTLHKG